MSVNYRIRCFAINFVHSKQSKNRIVRSGKVRQFLLNIFFGIYRTVSYASETLYKQDTCLSVFIVFGEVAEDGVSKPCKKKKSIPDHVIVKILISLT